MNVFPFCPHTATRLTKLALALSAFFSATLPAQESHGAHATADAPTLAPVVVTASSTDAPLEVSFDPKSAQQPLPAADGAALLKIIPGISIIRKGGANGDPVFRGMAASRLNILLDGEQILGGCGGRMDPPTAYIFPESYDRVTLLKGPQSVIHGPASAGVIMFEHRRQRFEQPGWKLDSSLTLGSFDRQDAFFDIKGGNARFYAEGIETYSHAGDYQDGDGREIHSRYQRHSTTGILGWTPDQDTRLELSAIQSDGEAAYADRGMDGSKFLRENYALKFEKAHIGNLLDKVEAQVYYNYIDHLMDNYSLRRASAMAMASNPDRETTGGRIAFTLSPADTLQLIVGGDWANNVHRGRSGGDEYSANYYRNNHRVEDARFADKALFAELSAQISDSGQIVTGLRGDWWKARDSRQSFNLGSTMMPDNRPNPSANHQRGKTLASGFVRYEHELADHGSAHIGLGHSERFPDFWELFTKEGIGQNNDASLSVFDTLNPEKTTQLDLGLTWENGPLQGFASVFYSKIDDYILIQSQYRKPAIGMGGAARSVTVARNVDATTWGGEAGMNYRFSPQWKGLASIAYVHGENDSDHHALGQIPPLEGRIGLDWESGAWSAGALLRLVAGQHRVARNEGNIVGQDVDKSSGFGVFSLNGSYRWSKTARIAFGIDNLFDKTYAEFISKSGETSMIQGYEQTTRVNEPGRTFWLRAQITLD
ncbi:MAG: TonB-dependent copper receptor [Azoarcus sp.]|jgi:iron complex outermembrane receptor protein|nr:TonB-dependent copper receptor [Azoarcus sp.]